MGDLTREKTIEELEEELKAASENYKRLNDLVKQKKDAEEKKRNQKLEAEKKDLTEQIREIYAEAKARGYDAKAMRSIVSLRKRDKDDIAEQEALIELYKSALGMG